jgi:hypothetical protein
VALGGPFAFQHHFGYASSMTQEMLNQASATARQDLAQRKARIEAVIAKAVGGPVEKARENRLRRAAVRQGYRLVKSRRRDPRALDYGMYWIVNEANVIEAGHNQGLNLDEVEAWLYPDQYRSA